MERAQIRDEQAHAGKQGDPVSENLLEDDDILPCRSHREASRESKCCPLFVGAASWHPGNHEVN